MSEVEGTRLVQLARALFEGNRHNAMRICRQFLKNPPSRLLDWKRDVWEIWQEELRNPDPEHGDRELMNLLVTGTADAELLEQFLKDYRFELVQVGRRYQKAFLSMLLIEQFQRFQGGQALPARTRPPHRGRRRAYAAMARVSPRPGWNSGPGSGHLTILPTEGGLRPMSDQQEAEATNGLVQAVRPAVLPPRLAPWVRAELIYRMNRAAFVALVKALDVGALPDDPTPTKEASE